MYIEERSPDTCVVKFSLTIDKVKAEWSQTCKPIGRRTARQVADEFASRVGQRLDWIRNKTMKIPAEALASRKALKAFVLDAQEVIPGKADNETIAKLVELYLESRRQEVATKQLSFDSYDSDRKRLNTFVAYCKGQGKSSKAAVVTAPFLEKYRSDQLKQIEIRQSDGKPHGLSEVSVKHNLRTVKAMLKWAYQREKVESLPRMVDAPSFAGIELPQPKVKVFTVKQIENLYTVASEQQRLWILLGLNCGYTQTDIANLSHDMVNWETGIIKRDRQKTGVDSEHKLWPLTLDMLRAQASDPAKHNLVLLNQRGNPLIQNTVLEGGEVKTARAMDKSFRKLWEKAKVSLTFKHLRKTGASAIENRFQDKPWLASLYLAHELNGPIRKHYTGQSFDEVHAATDSLAQYFGFNEGGTLSGLGGSNSQ